MTAKETPGCSATRPEAASPGRTSPVARIGACENSRFRGSSRLPHRETSSKPDYADPPSEAGFCVMGAGVAASLNSGPAHGTSARWDMLAYAVSGCKSGLRQAEVGDLRIRTAARVGGRLRAPPAG